MRLYIDRAVNIICRGSGGPPAHPAGSARGGATSQGSTQVNFKRKDISSAPREIELVCGVGCDLARRAAICAHGPHLPERAAGLLVQVGDPLAIGRPDRVAMRACARG